MLYPEVRFWLVQSRDDRRRRRATNTAVQPDPAAAAGRCRPPRPRSWDRRRSARCHRRSARGGLVRRDVVRAGVPRARTTLSQGIYALEQVVPVTGVPGAMRAATFDDRALVLSWFGAFIAEAVPMRTRPEDHDADGQLGRSIDARLGDGKASGIRLWEHDGEVVSLAAFGERRRTASASAPSSPRPNNGVVGMRARSRPRSRRTCSPTAGASASFTPTSRTGPPTRSTGDRVRARVRLGRDRVRAQLADARRVRPAPRGRPSVASERDVAVLSLRPGLAFGERRLQRRDEHRPSTARLDHVVE